HLRRGNPRAKAGPNHPTGDRRMAARKPAHKPETGAKRGAVLATVGKPTPTRGRKGQPRGDRSLEEALRAWGKGKAHRRVKVDNERKASAAKGGLQARLSPRNGGREPQRPSGDVQAQQPEGSVSHTCASLIASALMRASDTSGDYADGLQRAAGLLTIGRMSTHADTLEVVGKGNKRRSVPVPPVVRRYLGYLPLELSYWQLRDGFDEARKKAVLPK